MHGSKTFTPDEQQSAQNYQMSGYKEINDGLRTGRPLKGEAEEDRKNLDRLIDQTSMPEAVVVFRGGQRGSDSSKAGQTIEDKGFGSTSTDWNVAAHFQVGEDALLAIRVPKGSKALGIAKLNNFNLNNENEILLPRGSRYRVTDEVITKKVAGVGRFSYRVVDLLPPLPAAPHVGPYGPTEPGGQGTLFKSESERLRDKYSWKPGDVTIRPTTQAENDEADANVAAAQIEPE